VTIKDQEHASLKKKENSAVRQFMMKVTAKTAGVYKPMHDKSIYEWISNCMPTLDTQKLLWDEGLVVDAIGNPNRRCLCYALSQSIGETPTVIRD
jgi:hypothetical protein